MLNVTDRAKETLVRLRAIAYDINDSDVGLRLLLSAGGGQFGLQVDRPKPGDQVVAHAGATILLVDEDLADALEDATIDAESAGPGDDLVITRPRGRGAGRGAI